MGWSIDLTQCHSEMADYESFLTLHFFGAEHPTQQCGLTTAPHHLILAFPHLVVAFTLLLGLGGGGDQHEGTSM